ncbi:MAG: ketoacyl-ACP synthase III [Deltaproteobacteria bacterium]|nr:MAG: ketoacyl-ACP synthase III [Deltaproteobacteria bacterium]
MPRAKILGTGRHLPPRVVTNDELAAKLGVSAPWIEEVSGVRTRRYKADGRYPSDLALEASKAAIAAAGIEPADIDCIILGATLPEFSFPGVSCFLQEKLGLSKPYFVPCIELRQQDASFVYALELAQGFIEQGKYERILVVGVDTPSVMLDLSPRGKGVTPYFGDGAGAVVVGAEGDETSALLVSETHADGRYTELFTSKLIDISRKPLIQVDPDDPEENAALYIFFDAERFFPLATETLVRFIPVFLAAHGHTPTTVDTILLQQLAGGVLEGVRSELGIEGRTFDHIDRLGNTICASLPILLDEAVEAGRIERGDLVLLATFGSGVTWGGTLLRF